MANYPTLWLFLMMDEVNDTNTLSLRVDITRWRTLKLTHKLSKDITTIWALRLTNEYLMNKLNRNNITTIWGLCNMFNGGSKLLEMSLYSPKTNTSRFGHKRAVRTNFCPLRIGLCQCSVARSLFIRAFSRNGPTAIFSNSQWPPTVILPRNLFQTPQNTYKQYTQVFLTLYQFVFVL